MDRIDYSIERLRNVFLNSIGKDPNKKDISRIREYSIKSKENIQEVVDGPAYKDLTPRTIKGISKYNKATEGAKEALADDLYNYFNGKTSCKKQKDFDDFHKKICTKFINNIKKGTKGKIVIFFGKAQKIVNMSFKYIYCFKDASDKEEYFNYCHMPLDSFTLNWFCEKVKNKCDGFKKKYISSWSNLKYGEENKDFDDSHKYTYCYIQRKIKEYFNDNNEYKTNSSFKAEFYIWREQLLYESSIQLYRQLKNYLEKDNKIIINKDLKKKLADIREKISVIIKC